MPAFSWKELLEATGGSWLVPPTGPAGVQAIGTDSRADLAGHLFLALRGERFDGHIYVQAAQDQGAACLCVDRPVQVPLPTLLVADTTVAFQALAAFHRRRFPQLKVAAVTGSSGKTSTKEILRNILASSGDRVLATQGNTNNHIGVPQNLLRLTGQERFAVLEMGTSGPGEIEPLSRTAQPDVSLITSIGPVHLEGLGSEDGVMHEKATIAAGLRSNGRLIVPYSWRHHPAAIKQQPITFGVCPQADLQVSAYQSDGPSARFLLTTAEGTFPIEWPILGEHQACNAAAAVGAARELGIAIEQSVAALPTSQLTGMRMQSSERNGVRWLNDAYNANPDSMRALLRTVNRPQTGRLFLVLGDMLELGPQEAAYHQQILQLASEQDAELVPVGPRMTAAAQALGISNFANLAAASQRLQDAQPGDLVVLKASRGMALECLLPNG